VYVLQIIVALLLRHLQRVHMQPPARPHDGTWAKSARHRGELCVPTAGRLVVGEGAGVRSWRFRYVLEGIKYSPGPRTLGEGKKKVEALRSVGYIRWLGTPIGDTTSTSFTTIST